MFYGIVLDFTNKDLILPTKFVHLFHFRYFIKDLTHLTSKHNIIIITQKSYFSDSGKCRNTILLSSSSLLLAPATATHFIKTFIP